ncbi:hypothetical protein HanRHA438_Chr03g0132561 [Helianthus annuus]|uniref:Uncharacterized protein n=1 Tax=Helianthus annuus TaxID=4232 RepID=A0A9K3JHT1_HELAN|nr:hypothetical protein HanXRQr2_Chr03g0120651 [Helianthus annuus]KAJ0936554.1 hypothetical protein HanRHA438_Chr03g0132561 [Helianthus annuus]KAJ0944474.1 hypothetical protein HanPSC8_Chr03g0117181 [Helianthus annuus]
MIYLQNFATKMWRDPSYIHRGDLDDYLGYTSLTWNPHLRYVCLEIYVSYTTFIIWLTPNKELSIETLKAQIAHFI